MVCDLFMFLHIKKNPKVSCLFHTPRPGAGFALGFGGWGLLWGLQRRNLLINDGVGKVCRWDGYTETADFSTRLFNSKSTMTNILDLLVFVLVVCWGFGGFIYLFIFIFYLFSIYFLFFSIYFFLLLPFAWHIQGFALHCSPVPPFMLFLSAEMLFEPKLSVI